MRPTYLEKKMYDHIVKSLQAAVEFRKKHGSSMIGHTSKSEEARRKLIAEYDKKYNRVTWREVDGIGLVGHFQGMPFARIFAALSGTFKKNPTFLIQFAKQAGTYYAKSTIEEAKVWAEAHREKHTK